MITSLGADNLEGSPSGAFHEMVYVSPTIPKLDHQFEEVPPCMSTAMAVHPNRCLLPTLNMLPILIDFKNV